MITLESYLMGRDRAYPLNEELMTSALDLVDRLNKLQEHYPDSFVITSGYRPPEINETIKGARTGDAHETCRGVDLRDWNLMLSEFLLDNLELLEEIGLWMESPSSAKDHVHLQSYPPKSGNRVFIA